MHLPNGESYYTPFMCDKIKFNSSWPNPREKKTPCACLGKPTFTNLIPSQLQVLNDARSNNSPHFLHELAARGQTCEVDASPGWSFSAAAVHWPISGRPSHYLPHTAKVFCTSRRRGAIISSVVKQRCLTTLTQIGLPAGAKAHGKEGQTSAALAVILTVNIHIWYIENVPASEQKLHQCLTAWRTESKWTPLMMFGYSAPIRNIRAMRDYILFRTNEWKVIYHGATGSREQKSSNEHSTCEQQVIYFPVWMPLSSFFPSF